MARRDWHTGRPNFLHRSWGRLEPFDDSMPKILSEAGIHTHLATDHNHYFEDGGLNYRTHYTTWQYWRGQEGDPWIGDLNEPAIPKGAFGKNGIYSEPEVFDAYKKIFPEESDAAMKRLRYLTRQDWVNRGVMNVEENQPQARTFKAGLDFIEKNAAQDNWMLHIETFDPHEPFYTLDRYKALYAEHYDAYDGPFYDWPMYARTTDHPIEAKHLRVEYAALVSMCDEYLGKVMDMMDEQGMWDDTMLIVWTDHGFLLGEHDWWGKMSMPMYQEIAHTPFFVWDPRVKIAGERRHALVQPSIDLAPTLLNFFGIPPTKDMTGKDLAGVIANDTPVRDAAIFGMHGAHVNRTDGRYVYMRAPQNANNKPLFQYTLMPTHMRSHFAVEDFANLQVAEPFSFHKGAMTMRIENVTWVARDRQFDTMLWDTLGDPRQMKEIVDHAVETRLKHRRAELMADVDTPPEQLVRLGLDTINARDRG